MFELSNTWMGLRMLANFLRPFLIVWYQIQVQTYQMADRRGKEEGANCFPSSCKSHECRRAATMQDWSWIHELSRSCFACVFTLCIVPSSSSFGICIAQHLRTTWREKLKENIWKNFLQSFDRKTRSFTLQTDGGVCVLDSGISKMSFFLKKNKKRADCQLEEEQQVRL